MNILEIAADLGIKPTKAAPSSEIFRCYADRVRGAALFAWMEEDSADKPKTKAAIEEANRYAVN